MGILEVILCMVCKWSAHKSGRMPQFRATELRLAGKTWKDPLTLRAKKYQMSRLILQLDNERK